MANGAEDLDKVVNRALALIDSVPLSRLNTSNSHSSLRIQWIRRRQPTML